MWGLHNNSTYSKVVSPTQHEPKESVHIGNYVYACKEYMCLYMYLYL